MVGVRRFALFLRLSCGSGCGNPEQRIADGELVVSDHGQVILRKRISVSRPYALRGPYELHVCDALQSSQCMALHPSVLRASPWITIGLFDALKRDVRRRYRGAPSSCTTLQLEADGLCRRAAISERVPHGGYRYAAAAHARF